MQVNTVTAGDQFTPVIASLANGGHVVVWESGTVSSTGDTAGAVVRAQMFDANGQKAGSEITVFSGASINGWRPSAVIGLPDGSFIAAASDTVLVTLSVGGLIPEIRLYTQKVNASGQLVSTGGTSDGAVNGGLASLVAADTIANVIAIDGDRFLVNGDGTYALIMTRVSRPTPSSFLQQQLQTFDAAGTSVGGPIDLIFGGMSGAWPTTATLANGNILTAAGPDGIYAPIRWKILTRGGQTVADQTISAAPPVAVTEPAVAALADGTAVIMYQSAGSSWQALHIDASGNTLGTAALPIPTGPTSGATSLQLTGLSGGGYLVTWTPLGSNQVVGRYFTPAGQASGDEFVIASGVTTQFLGRSFYRIAAVAGGFIAVYQAVGSDGQEIYEIRFAAPTLG